MLSISILGTGWLGFAFLAKFKHQYKFRSSTRSLNRKNEIDYLGAQHLQFDLDKLDEDIDQLNMLLQSEVLLIAVPNRNIAAFQKLAERIQGSNVKHILYVSTTSVYKNCNCEIVEPKATQVESPFLAIEEALTSILDVSSTIIRFGGLIGYDRDPGRFFANKPIPNGQDPVNLIHRDDCIEILHQIIQQKKWGEVYHAAAPSHPSKAEFYGKHTKRFAQIDQEVIPSDPNTLSYKIINSSKLIADLNYQFKVVELMEWDIDHD